MTTTNSRPTFTFEDGISQLRAGSITAPEAAELLIAQMSDDELLWLLDGDTPFRSIARLPAGIKAGPIAGGAIPRLGIPGVQFSDGPRGVVMGSSTAFPVTMARAATWDPDLEERVGQAMGLEARAGGANYLGAVCVNLLRHPAWGRAQECYGEDPVLTGRMGVALTRGVRRNVMACVKHFALNSMENARFKVDVTVDDHALHEVYLPHFKAVVAAGAESVMSAYNSVNGHYAGENKVLLTDILRDEWGFDGFVTSDWVFGTHDAVESLEAGMDVEMPARMFRARDLPTALEEGRVSRDAVLISVRRILTTTLRHTVERDQAEPPAGITAGIEHRALARRVASRAAVLLKNDPVSGTPILPLPASTRRLAVLGRLAAEPNTGDHGSSLVHPPSTSSPLDGLREALPGVEIVHADGTDVVAAARIAADADAAVVVVGMSFDDEGERVENDENDIMQFFGFPLNLRPVQWLLGKLASARSQFGRGGDRVALTLHPQDEKLLTAASAANPRTVAVVVAGSAVIMESWRAQVPAILLAWYPGMEGGRAIADVLTGVEEPGGRLPFAVPTEAAHLPYFDAEARSIVYDAWWGQRKLDRDGHAAAYPFGFGLGYTTFDMELVDHRAAETTGVATARVKNTGPRTGSAVVQVYAGDADAPRVVPQLIGFTRVDLAAGAETQVDIDLDLTPTREHDPETRTWNRRPGSWRISAAPHSPRTLDGARHLFGMGGGR